MIAERFIPYQKPQMYARFTQLGNLKGCVNLGQGFPNFEPPQFLRQFLSEEFLTQPMQYVQTHGHPKLLASISNFYAKKIGYAPNVDTEIAVSSGATATLTCCFQGLLNRGDEVIVLDPAFDFYRPLIKCAEAIPKGVPIVPRSLNTQQSLKERLVDGKFTYDPQYDGWEVDYEILKNTLNDKTKILLLNSPLNPAGKIFTTPELDTIADLLDKYPNVVLLEDAAYQHITFGNLEPFNYPRPITHERLKARTVCVSSAGKLFSATGHRVGFAFGPAHLIKGVKLAQTYHLYCLSGPIQTATARCFDACLENNYFEETRNLYEKQAQKLLKGLMESRLKLNLWVPNGGYFVVSDISDVVIPEKYFIDEQDGSKLTRDFAFTHYLINEFGVVCIPCSPYYEKHELGENIVRWAFCKNDETIDEAIKRLK